MEKKSCKIIIAVVVLVIICLFAVPLMTIFRHLHPPEPPITFLEEIREATKKGEESNKHQAEIYPKVAHKLKLAQEGILEISEEQARGLLLVFGTNVEELPARFLPEIKKSISSNNNYYHEYKLKNPDLALKLEQFVNGTIQLSIEEIRGLADAYYGYIPDNTSNNHK